MAEIVMLSRKRGIYSTAIGTVISRESIKFAIDFTLLVR